MSGRALAGKYENDRPAKARPAPLTPLDYALRIMRDATQPAALRASMAKAALPYLHGRRPIEEPPPAPQDKPKMSQLELARRIAYIMRKAEGEQDERRRARRAKKSKGV